ncbi:50S ribosomal protein L4 [Peptococcaceae bacterium CEB3]|nr:50S ribosomal protein L4 [Peptococcaceae bacterium CEB3]
MPKVQVVNMQGAPVGEMDLNEDIFGIKPNQHAVHTTVVSLLAGRRSGSQSALLRSEVRGGGRKPWRQKGTGKARSGSTRSPIWRGGGVVFAPKPRKYGFQVPKKVRRLALCSALSAKVQLDNLIVLDRLKLEEAKTREMVKVLEALKAGKKTLVVTAQSDETVGRAARNIAGVKTTPVQGLNVFDILNHDVLVLTQEAVAKAEEVFA